MKRILIALLLFIGFFVASCEEEHHERRYGYRPYEHREYREHRDGYYGRDGYGYDGRRYRLLDETVQNDVVQQIETTVEP